MRMHTIPQNVTAYEDKIVGMLIGRQFVYLAIGGIIIFVLLTANIGPLFIRLFISIFVGLFTAALALLRLNDVGFDTLVLSYIKAMFGPTEWVWRKDFLPMSKLAPALMPAKINTANSSQQDASKISFYEQNLQRVSHYQSFIGQREESSLDPDEIKFIEQLNFSESVPQSAFDSVTESKPAPPMLTKANFNTVRQQAPATKPDPVVFPVSQVQPITKMAGDSSQPSMTIEVNGRDHKISLRHNQRTNRSLSRHLISAGIMPLPVRGEMQLDISPDLKNELASIKDSAPVSVNTTPETNLAGLPISQKMPTIPPHVAPEKIAAVTPPPAPATLAPTPTPSPASEPEDRLISKQSSAHRTSIDYAQDWAHNATVRQQIAALSQAPINSGITKGTTMSDSPLHQLSTSENQKNNQAMSSPADPAGGMNDGNNMSMASNETNLDAQQSSEGDGEASQTVSPQPIPPSIQPEPPQLSPDQSSEVDELTRKNQALEVRVKQLEAAITQIQQTTLPGQDQTQLVQHQQLLDQIKNEKQQVDIRLQDLGQHSTDAAGHHHKEFQPVAQVPPVLKEQTAAPAPAASPPPASAPQATLQQPTEAPSGLDQGSDSQLDLQDKMAAAGVGAIDESKPAAPAQPSTAEQPAAAASQQMAMTNQPNIINGRVFDAQGQSLPGVIVVVKNSQGEPKRALKTNKLGQFVVTTPLTNGSYMVEVDKKGLSFDIMKVDLNGAVLPPMEIRPKQ